MLNPNNDLGLSSENGIPFHFPQLLRRTRQDRTLTRLTDIQISLPKQYHFEIILKNTIVNAVKDIEECKLAYRKPASSTHGVISDLHSSLPTSPNNIQESSSQQNEIDPLMYGERQGHRRLRLYQQNTNS